MKPIVIGLLVIILIVSEVLWRRKNRFKKEDAIEIGKLLFDDKAAAFEEYVKLFASDKKQFNIRYSDTFEDTGLELEDLKFIDLITSFGIFENKILIIDWRGEENEGEIQKFCEEKIGRRITWTNVNRLLDKSRNNTDQLLKSINKDLNENNYQLVSMNRSNDSFELSAVSLENLMAIKKIKKDLFKKA